MLLELALPLHLAAVAVAAGPSMSPGRTMMTTAQPQYVAVALPPAASSAQSGEQQAGIATAVLRAPGAAGPSCGHAALNPAPAFAGPAVDAARLAAARGGTDQVNNNMNLNGTVSSNTAINVATGSNTIDAGSFANMSGIPMVVQNTGANVLIQNATIVNLQLQ